MRGYPSSLKLAYTMLISSIDHQHFCNSSPCKPSPQQTEPSSTMDSKAKKDVRRASQGCESTNKKATTKQVGEAAQQTTLTTTTCNDYTYDSMSQYRYQKWASTNNWYRFDHSQTPLLPHNRHCQTPLLQPDDGEMIEVPYGSYGDGVPWSSTQ